MLDDVQVVRGGRTVWSEGSFAVPRGSVVIVIGPNGSGKTTLLQLLLGLLPPASGEVTVLGEAPTAGSPRVGYVPQNYTGERRRRDPVPRPRDARHHRSPMGAAAAQVRMSAAASTTHSSVWALASTRTDGCPSSRADSSSGSPSRRRSSTVRTSCCSTSRSPTSTCATSRRSSACSSELHDTTEVTIFVVAHDLNPLLSVLTGAVYLLDGHPHYGPIGDVVDEHLLTHLYGTRVRVVRTAQGDFFTRSG